MSESHYRHLQQHFSYLIRQKVLNSGDKLPSEREIGEQFKLTRMTVRQGLQALEAEGLIYRQNRRGWFVSPPAMVYNPARLLSFIENVSNQGFTPTTECLAQQVEPADEDIANLMGLRKGAPVLFLHRRRYIDGRPVLIEKMYININLLPGIEEEDLSQSLTQLLAEKYGRQYRDMNLSFKSTSLPAAAAAELYLPSGHPGLHIQRINYTADKEVLEVDYEFWRHDAVTIQIEVRD